MQVGQVVRVDFTLQIGQIAEQMEVAGNAQMVDTSTTAVGTMIGNKQILELPLNGRDPLQLVGLSPNVTVSVRRPDPGKPVPGRNSCCRIDFRLR